MKTFWSIFRFLIFPIFTIFELLFFNHAQSWQYEQQRTNFYKNQKKLIQKVVLKKDLKMAQNGNSHIFF